MWCEWSQQSEKFDLKDQRRVWDSFKPGAGIHLATIFGLAKQNGWLAPESDRRPEPPLEVYAADINALPDSTTALKKGKKKAAPHVGNAAESLLKILKRYIFLKNQDRIYDTLTRTELTRSAFDGAFCHLFPENRVSWVLLNDPECLKVDDLIYLPGKTKNPVNHNGSVLWNTWVKPKIKLPEHATDEDVKPWLEHLYYLYPDTREQNHFLDWCAWVLQHPDIKINHGLVIAGTSRVGKDMMLNPLRFGIGEDNLSEAKAEVLKV